MRGRWPAAAALAAALCGLGLSLPARADGKDWRYCVAQDEAGGRFYLTEAFATDKPIDEIERSFNAWLDRAGYNHRWGICPRSPSAFDAASDVAHAAHYNKSMGLEQRQIGWPDDVS